MWLSKRKAKRIRQLFVGPACLICESTTARLVCDHNHETDRIRGSLCELCNAYIDIYERNLKRERQLGGERFFAWVPQYRDKIELHLQRDTGVPFHAGMCDDAIAESLLLRIPKRTKRGKVVRTPKKRREVVKKQRDGVKEFMQRLASGEISYV